MVSVPPGLDVVLQQHKTVAVGGAQSVCRMDAGFGVGSPAYVIQGVGSGRGYLLGVEPSQRVFLKGGESHGREVAVLVVAVVHQAPVTHGRIIVEIGRVEIGQSQSVSKLMAEHTYTVGYVSGIPEQLAGAGINEIHVFGVAARCIAVCVTIGVRPDVTGVGIVIVLPGSGIDIVNLGQ